MNPIQNKTFDRSMASETLTDQLKDGLIGFQLTVNAEECSKRKGPKILGLMVG